MTRGLDAAGERELIRRAERTGCDVRTLERAVVGWTPSGTVYLASGSMDPSRITTLLWERLLKPRRRVRDEHGNQRLEGHTARQPVALLVSPSCNLAGYSEGPQTRTVDRLIALNSMPDPDALLVWHATHIPDELTPGREERALLAQIREFELQLRAQPNGIGLGLTLRGSLSSDAEGRIRRAMDALVGSPLGEISGASQWLAPRQVIFRASPDTLEVFLSIPWRALTAIAEALRGEVGSQSLN